jgi:type IV secretion system protein VirB1
LKTQPHSTQEALRWATELKKQGMTLSVGLMQVNAEQGFSIQKLLDPCENLRTGWKLFTEKYAKALRRVRQPENAIRVALSDYNTGSPTAGQRNGYAARVLIPIAR